MELHHLSGTGGNLSRTMGGSKYLSNDECVSVAFTQLVQAFKVQWWTDQLLVSLSKYMILWIVWNLFWLQNVSQDNSLPLHAPILPWRHWACRSTQLRLPFVSVFQPSSNVYSMTWLSTKAYADSSLSKQPFREVRGHSSDYFGGRRRKVKEIAVLLNPTCFTEARAWHIWVIKYKDSLLKNYASKTFSDHT